MIEYQPRVRTRNEYTVAKLMEIAEPTPLDPAARLKRGAEMVMSAMAEIHGGEWRAQVDHQKRAVFVWEN